MAPEVADGIAIDRKQRGKEDVWAVGVMLHMLLTGKVPFKGKSD